MNQNKQSVGYYVQRVRSRSLAPTPIPALVPVPVYRNLNLQKSTWIRRIPIINPFQIPTLVAQERQNLALDQTQLSTSATQLSQRQTCHPSPQQSLIELSDSPPITPIIRYILHQKTWSLSIVELLNHLSHSVPLRIQLLAALVVIIMFHLVFYTMIQSDDYLVQ